MKFSSYDMLNYIQIKIPRKIEHFIVRSRYTKALTQKVRAARVLIYLIFEKSSRKWSE